VREKSENGAVEKGGFNELPALVWWREVV